MKNTFKRIAAFALILCMLLSVVPAVALAEETDSTSVKYDFRLNQTDLTFFYTNTNENVGYASINIAEVSNKGRDSRVALAEYYANGDINWKYHEVSESVAKNANFTIAANNEDGTPKVDYGAYIRGRDASGAHVAGSYFAVMIKSPGTGDYKLTLNYYKTKTAAPKGSVYVMPAGVTDIPGAMEYYAPVGSFTNDSTATSFTSTDAEMGTVSMKAGKDYLLVFTMDEVNASGNSYLYIGDVTLDLQAPAEPVPALDTISYNFELNNIASDFASIKDKNLTSTTVEALYDAKAINWNYHSANDKSNIKPAGAATYPGVYMTGYAGSTNYALNQWFAVTVRSPGAGNFKMTMNVWDSKYGAHSASVYLLPVGVADIASALTPENKIGTFDCESNSTTFTADTVTMDVEIGDAAEYLLVFTNDKENQYNTSSRSTLYVNSITLDRIVSMDEITYDFGLGNRGETYGDNVPFSGRDLGTSAAGKTAVAERYTAGTLNWKYVNGGNLSDTGTVTKWNFAFGATDVNYGLSIKSYDHSAGSYFVTTIKSPGYGDYTLTLDYNTHNTGASEARIYILPVNTADIAAAINVGTAVATFSCDDPAITDGKALGEKTATFDVSLGMDEEYLMVFTNNKPATTSKDPRATIYLSGIKLTNKAAGGAEEVSGDYIADGKTFATFAEAVAAAYDADDLAVKLNADVAMDELIVPANLSIDLNGKTLTVDALSGSVTDSSAGNTGLLAAERDTIVFSAKNADAPLWDAAAGGYRFFDYLLEVFDEAEAVEGKPSSQKFWFKFHFYTDDACTELDQDAYALVAGGNSGFKVATHMSWNGEALPSVYYGIDGDVDAFSRGWATNATASRWLYIRVDGLDEDLYGTLRVKPELEANGVYISNTVVSYVNEAPDTAE